MTGRASDRPSTAKTAASKLELQRIRVDAQGYDADGAYWGAGPDVFIARIAGLRHDATMADGAQEITIRAKTMAQAREKVAAELARKPSDVRPREPLGGASPHKTRHEIDWRDPVSGTTVRVRITHSRDYLSQGQDHVEVESIAPKKAALPITETGYRSQFVSPLDLVNDGGPVTFATGWLDREAKGRDWQKRQTTRQQGDLFQWAEAQGEVGKRKAVTKPKRPSAKPAKARARRRDHA